MKAVVNDKNHLTFVSHLSGVTIIESSGFIIDLDYQCLASICEIANLGNTYTIKDCDEIESLKSNNNELTERIKFLEGQLTNSGNRITELRNQIEEQENEYKDIIVKKDKIIEEKTNSLIKLENIEDTLNATVKVNEELNTQLSRSKEDIASAARAIGDCRYYISLKDVLDKYENDIVDFNVSAMDIYYIHKASPNVVRKFNYDNFNITCKDQRTANTINTLLNCSNISVYDIMDKFKDDIAYSNTH